jgi:N-formylglutamate amidohydrolase
MKVYELLVSHKPKIPILVSIPHSGTYIPVTTLQQANYGA